MLFFFGETFHHLAKLFFLVEYSQTQDSSFPLVSLFIVLPELAFSLSRSRALDSFVCLPIFLPSLLVFRSCLLCLCFLCVCVRVSLSLSLFLSRSLFTPFVCLLFDDLISFLTTLWLDLSPFACVSQSSFSDSSWFSIVLQSL
jgi:hypothetical protein